MELRRSSTFRPQAEGPAAPPLGARQRPLRLWRRRGAEHPRPLPARETIKLSIGLLVFSGLLWMTGLHAPAHHGPGHLWWWELAAGFALADLFVFHIEINRDAHTFSFSEVPFVLGLFFASPLQLIVGRLVGEALILVFNERQSPVKLVFNLSLFLGECCTALAVFGRLIGGRSIDQPLGWAIAFLAVGTAGALSVCAVATVIQWHGGRTSWARLAVTAAVTATCNTCLAIVAGILTVVDPPAVALLGVLAAGMYALYRGYSSLRQRYSGLEMLYDFARVTSSAQNPQATLERILEESRRLLRADAASIFLAPAGEREPWLGMTLKGEGELTESKERYPVPITLLDRVAQKRQPVLLPGGTKSAGVRALLSDLGADDSILTPMIANDRVTGILVVCDRLGDVSTFDDDDTRILSTLAAQAAVALENGRLIDRLHTEAELRQHEALHDPLTDLANRTRFSGELDSAVARASADGSHLAVAIMDLDRFKEVNDALGHQAGDQLLQHVARRVSRIVGDRGCVARLGGDEFAILLPDATSPEQALEIAQEVHIHVASPATVSSIVLEIDASVGVAFFPDHGRDAATLMQRADVAMYDAKTSRRGVALYDAAQDWNTPHRLRLASELRSALQSGELTAHYQPISLLSDSTVVCAEALARWDHPLLGRLYPDEFIPIAERSGLIDQLTMCILGQALDQLRSWRESGWDLNVAVNLPVQALLDMEFPTRVARLLRRKGVRPESLTLEITESGLMSNPDRMIGVLGDLARSGVRLAIDDFGTGYSSFQYLQRLPVSELKIDKSFILSLTTTAKTASIVHSIAELGHNLGLTVVAEGVEDLATLNALRGMNCDLVQGYYFSRPVPGEELLEWLGRDATIQTRAG